MDNIWSTVNLGNIPVPILAVMLFCVVGIIASGKPAETFGRVCACLISYVMMFFYSPNLYENDIPLIKKCLDGIPFLYSLSGENQDSIVKMFFSDFTRFSEEFLKLFIFSLIIDMFLTVFNSAVKFAAEIKNFGLGYILPWFVRYVICLIAMNVYSVLYVFVLSQMPKALWLAVSIVVTITTMLMLLTPLIEFIILWADLIPNSFVHSLSKFIKEHKLGGVLQVSFFAAFSMLSIFVCIQQLAPNLIKGVF